MSWNDANYFKERALTERKLAEEATDPAVAGVHLELASRYEDLISEGNRPTLSIVSPGADRRDP